MLFSLSNFYNIILIMNLPTAKKLVQKLTPETIIFFKKSYNFTNDQNFLFSAYAKALKTKAYRLYVDCISLISEKRNEISSEELKKMTECDKDTLIKCFETLFKFKLIKPSIGSDNNIYVVFYPESRLQEILKNPKLLKLFKENLSSSQFEKIFSNNEPYSYIPTESVEDTPNFINFDGILLKMLASKKKNVSIDEECKQYLTNNFDFSEEQIVSLLNLSLIEHPEMFTVSMPLLKEEAIKLANILNAEATKREFHFDQNIFTCNAIQMQEINLEQIKQTCENFKPLEFYSNIAKRQLTIDEVDFLESVDKTIDNAKINLALALCFLIKTSKRFVKKYWSLVFKTLSDNSNWTFEDALRYWNHNYKPETNSRTTAKKLF